MEVGIQALEGSFRTKCYLNIEVSHFIQYCNGVISELLPL
jgi:hypothetical protein